ncbi:MAG: sulfurtransferase TusA [Pseudomonadales bacterium]
MGEADVDFVLDTQGLYCPEPVMMLHNQIRDMASGQTLLVQASDPSTQRDIPKFCTFLGHELIEQCEQNAVYLYCIRKGDE